jgi:hypothetical protein
LVPRRGRRRRGERGVRVRCRMSRHGTGVAAPGLLDSGGRCTLRGHGMRVVSRGGDGVSDAGTTADRWGAMMRSPMHSNWVRGKRDAAWR